MSRRLVRVTVAFLAAFTMAAGGCGPRARDYEKMAPATRLLAIEAGGPEAPGAAPALVDLLAAEKAVVRAQAAQTLGEWAATGNIYQVLPALIHKDPLVRGLAQAAYLEHSAYGLAPVVVEGNVVEVPPQLLEALAELGDPQGRVGVDPIILAERDALRADLDGDPETAVLAADLLARIGDVGARRTLIRLVEASGGLVPSKAAIACVRDEMGLGPLLLATIFADGPAARRAVMRALVVRPDPQLKPLAIQGLHDRDAAVRHNAFRALGNLGGAAPIEMLAAKLSASAEEQHDAILALGAAGKPGAEALRRYLRAGNHPERLEVTALLALAPNANRDDIPWIAERLKSTDKYRRAAAVTALGRIGHPEAQAAVMGATGDGEPLVRATAAKALGRIGTLYGAQWLIQMLEDPSPLVRSMAAWGLGQSSCPGAVEALKRVIQSRPAIEATPSRLGDVYGWPDLAATEALGKIGDADAVAVLCRGLESKSWLMRATAAKALGMSGAASAEVIQALEKRLEDPVHLVRAEALLSLKALGKTFEPGHFQSR